MKIPAEVAAAIVHEVNRTFRAAIGEDPGPEWEKACPVMQDSSLAGVLAQIKNPDRTPEQSHEGWMKHYQDLGWTYGEVKDPVKKTHPCLVPYSELPEPQRIKDYLFQGVVKALQKHVGVV